MMENKKESTMTAERANILIQIGFYFDAHKSTWIRRYQELKLYYEQNGHSNVPSNYPPNPQLSTWCKFQRRQYKTLMEKKPKNNSNEASSQQHQGSETSGQSLTPQRIAALESIGFQWQLRQSRS
jgi:hypothetical protein